MKEQKLKTVFIDWYGTLSVNTFWEQWHDPSHPQHNLVDDVEQFYWQEKEQLLEPWMRGKLSAEDFVNEVAKATGSEYKTLLKGLKESCEAMKFVSPEIPSLVNGLQAKKISVIIATDNMDTFSRWTMKSMKLLDLFDGVLNSHDLGALKQDFGDDGKSLFFGKYLEYQGIEKGEAILLDDSLRTKEIGKRTGMKVFQLPFRTGLVPALQDLVV